MGAAKIPTPRMLSKVRIHTEQDMKEGVLDGCIPSTAYNTACTSNSGMVGDPFIQTGQPSIKVFTVTDGHITPGSTMANSTIQCRNLHKQLTSSRP